MLIEVWSDVVCPWCYIGKRKLELALSQYEGPEPEVRYRAFQLDPRAPRGPGTPVREAYAKKFGGDTAPDVDDERDRLRPDESEGTAPDLHPDPDAPKHRGISFLLTPKSAPGISVRPLINMAWSHGFNETFFEDVHIPVSNRVGEENRGWYVGMTLLDYERSNITGAVSSRRTLDELREYLKTDEGKRRSPGYAQNRLNVAERYIETDVMFNFSFRIISMQERGLIPNHEASVSKLFNSEMSQKIALTGTRVFGLYAQIYDRKDDRAPMKSNMTRAYQQSVSATIAAGTSEIQRNIIATRGLGLPRG